MQGTQGKDYLKQYIVKAKPLVQDFLSDEENRLNDEHFPDVAIDLLSAFKQMAVEGKGIRGALVELFYKACGGLESEKILKASIFIELFHAAILVQDDFMDSDPLRRGIPAIHKQFSDYGKKIGVKINPDHYGNSVATCIADSGFYYSWKVLLNSGFSPEIILSAGKQYAEYIARLGIGQAMDMSITGQINVKEEDALQVLLLKSAEYTSILPATIGALLAGEKDSKKLQNIKEYAKRFGWAFQIQDDILGLFSKEEELGKPVGSDLREGKNTLLMIHLRKSAVKEYTDFQNQVLGNSNISTQDVIKMKTILKDSGVYDKVLQLGWTYVKEAIEIVPQITSDEEIATILKSLAMYMMERTK